MASSGEMSASNFSVSPVPGNGLFTVTVAGSGMSKYSLSVYNMSGTRVLTENITPAAGMATRIVDLRSSPDGIYAFEITSATGRMVRKVVVGK